MKTIVILIAALALTSLCYFIFLAYRSHTGTAKGLINSQLSPCPASPNCICTEFSADTSHFTDAINYTVENADTMMQHIQSAIKKSGGKITGSEGLYISATYTSTLFRYVDDFEVRLDSENKTVHIRSASRVGKSDFGANLKRINLFKNLLALQ